MIQSEFPPKICLTS